MSAAPRLALIRPRDADGPLELQPPYGLECIAGYMKAHSVSCRIFDRQLPVSGDLFAQLDAFAPDVIGLSIMSRGSMTDALRIVQRCRGMGCRFFAGGLFVTTATAQAEAMFPADVVLVRGEGERALLALLRGQSMPGLRTQPPGDTPARICLDDTPLSPDDWPVADRQRLMDYVRAGCAISIRSARGCPGHCAFCATPGLPAPLCRHAVRDLQKIAREMRRLCDVVRSHGGIATFHFVDDDFGPLARVEALCAALQSQGCRAAFSLELRGQALYTAPHLDERLRRLRAGGLCRLFVGLESLDPDTLQAWQKPLDPARLLPALAAVKRAEIALHIGYILWHDRATLWSIARQACTLHTAGLFSPKLALSRLMLYPGSTLFDATRAQSAHPQPLSPAMETAYRAVERSIAPLYAQWNEASDPLPAHACQAYLTGDYAPRRACEARVDAINRQSFHRFMETLKAMEPM